MLCGAVSSPDGETPDGVSEGVLGSPNDGAGESDTGGTVSVEVASLAGEVSSVETDSLGAGSTGGELGAGSTGTAGSVETGASAGLSPLGATVAGWSAGGVDDFLLNKWNMFFIN